MDMMVIAMTVAIGLLVMLLSGMLVYGTIVCWHEGSRIIPVVFIAFAVLSIAMYIVTVIGVYA